jgi:hypothetical protein
LPIASYLGQRVALQKSDIKHSAFIKLPETLKINLKKGKMNFKIHEVRDKKFQPSAVYLSLFTSLQIYVHTVCICYLQPKFNFAEQSPGEKGGGA